MLHKWKFAVCAETKEVLNALDTLSENSYFKCIYKFYSSVLHLKRLQVKIGKSVKWNIMIRNWRYFIKDNL
jgi:hypothetical protein